MPIRRLKVSTLSLLLVLGTGTMSSRFAATAAQAAPAENEAPKDAKGEEDKEEKGPGVAALFAQLRPATADDLAIDTAQLLAGVSVAGDAIWKFSPNKIQPKGGDPSKQNIMVAVPVRVGKGAWRASSPPVGPGTGRFIAWYLPVADPALASYKGNYNTFIGYNEELAHLIYAGSDFLLMPSRVEPCGLNQMYSLRYGTIPIVRRTGGLKDTVIDFGDDGNGICHDQASVGDICYSIQRAVDLYEDKKRLNKIRKLGMSTDHSWERVCQEYIETYNSIINKNN